MKWHILKPRLIVRYTLIEDTSPRKEKYFNTQKYTYNIINHLKIQEYSYDITYTETPSSQTPFENGVTNKIYTVTQNITESAI